MAKGNFITRAGKTFWIGAIILFVLLIMSFAMLSVNLYEMVRTDDNAVMLTSDMHREFDVFSMSYSNETGEITVSSHNSDNVIAPGTETDYYIRLKNDDDVAIDYVFLPEISTTNDMFLPIKIRLSDPDGNFFIGGYTTWVYASEVEEIPNNQTLRKGDFDQYILQWKWDFEGNDGIQTDELDTMLGNLEDGPFLTIKVIIESTANTTIVDNGGFIESGVGEIILYGAFILVLIAAIVLLFMYSSKKFKKQ